MQPRYAGRWWADQHGNEWSAFDLWKGGVGHTLFRVCTNDDAGVRVYQTAEDELLHLVRIPPPDVSELAKDEFYAEWDDLGQPPAR